MKIYITVSNIIYFYDNFQSKMKYFLNTQFGRTIYASALYTNYFVNYQILNEESYNIDCVKQSDGISLHPHQRLIFDLEFAARLSRKIKHRMSLKNYFEKKYFGRCRCFQCLYKNVFAKKCKINLVIE